MSLISFSEINKLICVQQLLEKSISSIIEHLKVYFRNENIIFDSQPTDVNLKCSEEETVQASIKKIIHFIREKALFLKTNKSMDGPGLKQFKQEMILIQDSIQTLTNTIKTKLKEKQIEFIDINQDVDYYNEKIFDWSQPLGLNNKINCKPYKALNSGIKCAEIREFMDFVSKSGGHENGWTSADHQLFLKYRKKYQDIEVVAKIIHEILPDKDMYQIKEHDEWYKKYLLLKSNKKNAIIKWKESKIQFNKVRSTDEIINNSNVNTKKIYIDDEDLKEKLTKWKQEKESKLKNDFYLEQMQEQKRKEAEVLKKKKQDEIKKCIEDWKKTKTFLEQEDKARKQLLESNEKKLRAAEANKLIKHFQTQDDYYVLKIKQQRKSKQAHLNHIRSKSSQLAPMDPQRVLKPTQQWINRVHDENIYPINTCIPVLKLPKLGVPEWRRKVG